MHIAHAIYVGTKYEAVRVHVCIMHGLVARCSFAHCPLANLGCNRVENPSFPVHIRHHTSVLLFHLIIPPFPLVSLVSRLLGYRSDAECSLAIHSIYFLFFSNGEHLALPVVLSEQKSIGNEKRVIAQSASLQTSIISRKLSCFEQEYNNKRLH